MDCLFFPRYIFKCVHVCVCVCVGREAGRETESEGEVGMSGQELNMMSEEKAKVFCVTRKINDKEDSSQIGR